MNVTNISMYWKVILVLFILLLVMEVKEGHEGRIVYDYKGSAKPITNSITTTLPRQPKGIQYNTFYSKMKNKGYSHLKIKDIWKKAMTSGNTNELEQYYK